jgi:hypothetical protein
LHGDGAAREEWCTAADLAGSGIALADLLDHRGRFGSGVADRTRGAYLLAWLSRYLAVAAAIP